MKNVLNQILLLILSGLLIFSCDNLESIIGGETQSDVNSVDDMDTDATENNPIITSINPAAVAYGGVEERSLITITGQYFNPTASYNNVHFDDKPGTVVSASATELVVQAPGYFTDSITIKVDCRKSIEFATYGTPYELMTPLSTPGNVDKYDAPYGMCLDRAGNLYFNYGTSKKVDKITPDGVRSEYLTIKGKLAYDMKFGPDDAIYYTYTKYLMKHDSATNSYAKSSSFDGQNAEDLDFDQNDHLYSVFTNEIFRMELVDLAHTSLYKCGPDTVLSHCKYYDGYLYVVAQYTGGGPLVWKFGIDDVNGIITSTEELVFDFALDAVYSDANITNMMISNTGTLYFSTTNYSLIMVDPLTDEVSKVYPELIGSEIGFLATWGENSEIYLNTTNSIDDSKTTIMKVLMFEETAPYYGRQ